MSAVIFDLDGTLVDSVGVICGAANATLSRLNLPLLSVEEARQYVGNGAEVFLTRTLTARNAFDPQAFPGALEQFLRDYSAAPGADNHPYPGVEEVLQELVGDGLAIGLCTNKPMAPTLSVLEAQNWKELFGVVIAGDTLAEKKPHPAPLLAAAKALGRTQTVFVGDSEVDAATAQAADLPFVLYTEGYRKTPIESLPHRSTFSDYADLVGCLREIVSQP
ncbi:MAG: phosphoglycolate phosphatase [Filomicrobium sp.]